MELKPGQKVRLVRIGRHDAYCGYEVQLVGHVWTVKIAAKGRLGGYSGSFRCDKFPQVTCFAEAYFEPLEGRNKL